MPITPVRQTITRSRFLSFCNSLEESLQSPVTTVYLPPGIEDISIDAQLAVLSFDAALHDTVKFICVHSVTGAVVIKNPSSLNIVVPPFPIQTLCLFPYLELEPLKSLIFSDYVIGVILVRLGAFALGVAKGETLLTSKVGTGNIHGRHRQGGSSANRFRRHREKQMEYFFTRLCEHAREHIEPCVSEIDCVLYGGARTTIELLKKQCEFIGSLEKPELPPHLDIRDPRQKILESSIVRAYSVTVYQWRED